VRPSAAAAAAAALALSLAGAARAAAPPPVGIPDIVGARTLGLSATIGTAAGNDGIYVNPAALAARQRYSIEAGVLVDRRGSATTGEFFGGSVVDSKTSQFTAGASYLRSQEGAYTGGITHVAVAGTLAERFYLGISGKYLSLKGASNVSAATGDAGIFWEVADLVSVGVTGYNLVPIGNDAAAPTGAGAGIAIGNDRSVQVTGDWRADFDRLGKTANRWAVGVEALLGNLVPVRAGWMQDEVLDTTWWSIGAGLVTKSGVALDVGYRQSIPDPSARTFAASLKLFLNM
jgi:hypothetical protein